MPDWRALPAKRAIRLAESMLKQPESWARRTLNPEWQWNDPALHALAQIVDNTNLAWWVHTKAATDGEALPPSWVRNGLGGFPTPDKPATEFEAVPMDELDLALFAPRTMEGGSTNG